MWDADYFGRTEYATKYFVKAGGPVAKRESSRKGWDIKLRTGHMVDRIDRAHGLTF